MTKSRDPVPAIVETEATGITAEIFSDIRDTLNVDVVNLIWRHLATMPGACPDSTDRARFSKRDFS